MFFKIKLKMVKFLTTVSSNGVVEDVSTDGKWCYIVFWVVGKPSTRWGLLKKRLMGACPSCTLAWEELQNPKPPDVFLLKFCCPDRRGLLHGNSYIRPNPCLLCRLHKFANLFSTRKRKQTPVLSDPLTESWRNFLADVTEVLCELELTIKRVKVSTTPDGKVMDLFFITDTRSLHSCRNVT